MASQITLDAGWGKTTYSLMLQMVDEKIDRAYNVEPRATVV